MRRFRNKDDVLLKDRTAGTSNEISMSVLDATKEALDDESTGLGAQKPSGRTPLGFIRLFTLRGRRRQVATPTKEKEILYSADLEGAEETKRVSSPVRLTRGKHERTATETAESDKPATTWVAPQEEISSRKHHRRRGRFIAAIAGGVAVAALVAIGVIVAINYFGHQETLREKLDRQLAAVDKADESLMALDRLIAQQIALGAGTPEVRGAGTDMFETTGLAPLESFDALEPSLDQATELLQRAAASIEAAKGEMGDARDYEVANEAIAAIDARYAMIETGERLMKAAVPLREAQVDAASCWNSLLAGDDAAREAAAMINETTQANARASIERSQAALTAFEQSRERCTEAATLAPLVDLAPYEAYIDLRIEAQQAALAADQAYLDRDKVEAATENDRYNQLDSQAVEAAKTLQGNPADLIGAVLVETIKPDVEAYGAERQKAGAADELLRNYLARRS